MKLVKCSCCRKSFEPPKAVDTVCPECTLKVMGQISRHRTKASRKGAAKKITACPDCAAMKKETRLGAVDMREHRYRAHGWDFRQQRYVNKGKPGRPKRDEPKTGA